MEGEEEVGGITLSPTAHGNLQIGRHFPSPYISFKQCGRVAS